MLRPVIPQVLVFIPGRLPPPAVGASRRVILGDVLDTANAGLTISSPAGSGSTSAT